MPGLQSRHHRRRDGAIMTAPVVRTGSTLVPAHAHADATSKAYARRAASGHRASRAAGGDDRTIQSAGAPAHSRLEDGAAAGVSNRNRACGRQLQRPRDRLLLDAKGFGLPRVRCRVRRRREFVLLLRRVVARSVPSSAGEWQAGPIRSGRGPADIAGACGAGAAALRQPARPNAIAEVGQKASNHPVHLRPAPASDQGSGIRDQGSGRLPISDSD